MSGRLGVCRLVMQWAMLLVMSMGLYLPAHSWIVDFNDLPSGTVVTTQYSQFLTFSSSPGHENYALAHPMAGDPPNLLASGASGSPSFMEDTYMDFTIAVRDFQILAIVLDSSTGVIGQVRIFENGIFTQSHDIEVDPNPGPFWVQFNGLDNMTRFEIVNLSAPVGWDGTSANVVPEPVGFASVAFGLAALTRTRRLRRPLADSPNAQMQVPR